MTRVDFYILAAESTAERLDFTCRLVEKAQQRGKRVFVATRDGEQTVQLNRLLWAFRPESFIGHSTVDEARAGALEPSPVLLGHSGDGGDHHDLLINLGDTVPGCFSRFERLAEVVVQAGPVLQATRNNYAFYRDRGYPIQSHQLRGRAPA